MHVLTLIGCVLFSDVGLGDGGGGEEAGMEEAGSEVRVGAHVCVRVWPR